MILLALLAMLVTVVVVIVIRDKKNNYHGPLYQCVLDVQHGEIDQYLNDSLDGTSYTTTCKTMLAINQTTFRTTLLSSLSMWIYTKLQQLQLN